MPVTPDLAAFYQMNLCFARLYEDIGARLSRCVSVLDSLQLMSGCLLISTSPRDRIEPRAAILPALMSLSVSWLLCGRMPLLLGVCSSIKQENEVGMKAWLVARWRLPIPPLCATLAISVAIILQRMQR